MRPHIHPITDRMLTRQDRETLLGQKSACFWLTGLSGSGKSTIALAAERSLYNAGYLVQILDGDNLRFGLNSNLGFSDEDRQENIRRVAEVAKLYIQTGVIVICSFVSPTIAIRKMARHIIGPDFNEIYVNASLEICEDRDVKGLYQKARAGEIKDFTGIHQPFEIPEHPDYVIESGIQNAQESAAGFLAYVLDRIKH